MGRDSAIAWTTHTFNPWIGCTKVSPGCKHCYAETWATRFGRDFSRPQRTSGAAWRHPARWNAEAAAARRRDRVFVASLADVFDLAAEDSWRRDLFELIAETPALDWLVLTKRPRIAHDWLFSYFGGNPLPRHVWLGVSVETQEYASDRLGTLLATPAAVRFVSYEPALGPVDWWPWLMGLREVTRPAACLCGHDHGFTRCRRTGGVAGACHASGCACSGFVRVPGSSGLDWIIVGGESGPGARAFDLDWARSTVEQCARARVPVFVKQLGSRPLLRSRFDVSEARFAHLEAAGAEGWSLSLQDSKGADPTEWGEDLRVQQWPVSPAGLGRSPG